MSLGEEETRTPHTHTPSHSQRRAAQALKGKPRCPARDPGGSEPRNAEFPGPDGARGRGSAAASQGASRAIQPLFRRESGGRQALLWSPHLSSPLEPKQLGRGGGEEGSRGALTSVYPNAAGGAQCPRRQVARLDGALMGRGDSGVTQRPRARAARARRRATGRAPCAWETRRRQVAVLRVGRASG